MNRRYLSKKISEVLLEIDSINRDSKHSYQFQPHSLRKEEGLILEKYRKTLEEAKAFKKMIEKHESDRKQ
jgi:hypothetical protein